MALQEKVVRLSHQQLKELAKKYERNDSDDTDAQTGHGMYQWHIMCPVIKGNEDAIKTTFPNKLEGVWHVNFHV